MASTAAQQRQQLAEYESQLSDVNALISAGGEEDPSLSSLKSDLLELIALTRAELSELDGDAGSTIPTSSAGTATSAAARLDGHEEQLVTASAPSQAEAEDGISLRKTDELQQHPPPAAASATEDSTTEAAAAAPATAATETATKKSKSKKSSKGGDKPPSKFEIPPHLIPLESDTEPQRKQKRRTIKALKRKWKERVREVELGEKRSTWQNFVGGGSKRKAAVTAVSARGSIFATPEDGVGAKIGVVGSGRGMTDYAKRAKHG